MIKQYLKQGWALIKQNRFYTTIYITGTALAITMTIIIAIIYHIRSANIAPEVYRDRMLLVTQASAINASEDFEYNWRMSYQTLKECYYPLQTPQLVAAGVNTLDLGYTIGDFYVGIPAGGTLHKSYIYCTDAAFLKIFRYTFLSGRPYSEEEFQSGMRTTVLSEKLAYKLFNNLNILNKTVLINDVEYTVIGVVKDVPSVLTSAYAELWIPFSSVPSIMEASGGGNIVGLLQAFILADKRADFPMIKDEIEKNINRYNTSLADWEYRMEEILTPFRVEMRSIDYSANFRDQIIKYGLIALIFLMVPAINLSGITSSRMQERLSEIGIRKAFGANRTNLIQQVLTENLLLTLLGGLVGLFLSVGIVYFMRSLLLGIRLGYEISLSFSMLFNLPVFGYTLGICLILNGISSSIPVWNAARRPIVQAINDK